MEHAIMCPQCNAPLSPPRFASFIVCSYCGTTVQLDESSVSAALFHEAFRLWNAPESYQASSWVSVGNSHWALDRLIAHGDISDVYAGRRARWPTELVILKLLRNPDDIGLAENEWSALQALQQSDAPGADTFSALIPQPVLHGIISGGSFTGRHLSIFRWAGGFHHTFDEVIQAYPQGIPPRASIWIWRRILEVLSFIHASGRVHGAVIPPHLLIQENEHGVRLVGYGFSGRQNENLRTPPGAYQSFYPQPLKSWSKLTAQLDLVLSARCIVAILGGNPATASLPAAVLPKLAGIIRRIALSPPAGLPNPDAWALREELGEIAGEVFGPPQFIPIQMPAGSPPDPLSG